MTWRTSGDLGEFVTETRDLLRADVAANTIILTALENLAARGPNAYSDQEPRYGWWVSDGVVAGAYLQTPPFPVPLTELP
jgi:phage gp46-like protein